MDISPELVIAKVIMILGFYVLFGHRTEQYTGRKGAELYAEFLNSESDPRWINMPRMSKTACLGLLNMLEEADILKSSPRLYGASSGEKLMQFLSLNERLGC